MRGKILAWDRFIPSRSLIDFDKAFLGLGHEQQESEAQWEMSGLELRRYRKREELHRQLEKIIGMNERILRISPDCGRARDSRAAAVRLWPCRPRKKPLIQEEKILDMPDFNWGFHLNPIDWGANDCLATSVENKILIGRGLDRLEVNKETVLEYEDDRATAVSWSPDGKNLALGSEAGHVLVWQLNKKDLVTGERCCSARRCTVTVLHWHPESNVFAWGCTSGKLSFRTVTYKLILNLEKAHKGYVCGLKYSPRGNYICSSGEDAYLRIWKGPDYHPYMEIEMGNPSRAVDWHPWKTGLLAIGEGPPAPGSLSLWNVNTSELLFMKKLPESKAITALTFNPLTGELVFSQCLGDAAGLGNDGRSEILVLGSPHTVLDSITNIAGNVMSLIWNPDYSKLGTAGSDETFRIWDFHRPVGRGKRRGVAFEDLNFLALRKFNSVIR